MRYPVLGSLLSVTIAFTTILTLSYFIAPHPEDDITIGDLIMLLMVFAAPIWVLNMVVLLILSYRDKFRVINFIKASAIALIGGYLLLLLLQMPIGVCNAAAIIYTATVILFSIFQQKVTPKARWNASAIKRENPGE